MRSLPLIIFSFLILFSPRSFANNYEKFLIDKAAQLDLANDQDWLNMVYYKKNLITSGYESIFDSQNFFLAKDGKTDPKAELEATISSFFKDDFLSFKDVYENHQTAQCAFKGRYEWLSKKLNFDAKKLPEQKCKNFDKWYKEINPKSAILIFSSSYLNNPASMFGHTFLLIGNKDSKNDDRIISQALNYSAKTAETNGVIFAYKGIFGLYDGKFSIVPYYKMIKQYNNSENRDLWEYDLKLSDSDLRMLMTNLWEVGNNHANYYFFSENCSYMLLKILQIVRPQIEDKNKILKWVIPSDTVISINKIIDLSEGAKYRPSRASKINYLGDLAGKKVSKLAKDVAQNKDVQIEDLSENDKKLLYDLSYEYLQYSYEKRDDLNRSEMAKTSIKILNERSKISGKTNIPEIPSPNSNPVLAHDPSRLFLSYGYNNFRKDFVRVDLRPAYHDLLDSNDGFLNGAAINVLDLSVQYFREDDRVKLNYLNVVDIKSYSPRNLFFKPISWELKVGAENLYIADQDFKTAAVADFGVGFNYEIDQLRSSISLIGATTAYYGENIPDHDIYALAPKLNIITNLTDALKLNLSVRHNFFTNDFDYTEYKAQQNLKLDKNLSLRIYYQKKDFENYADDEEFGGGINYYF